MFNDKLYCDNYYIKVQNLYKKSNRDLTKIKMNNDLPVTK